MAKKKSPFLMYKDKPLVRVDNTVYYGDLDGKYLIVMHIRNTANVAGRDIASDVLVELQENNAALGKGRVVKKAERDGLYTAIDIGAFWLEEAMEEE